MDNKKDSVRRLKHGVEFKSTFKKFMEVKGVLWNDKYKVFGLWDETQFYVWNPRSERITHFIKGFKHAVNGSHYIKKIIYSPKYQLYFVVGDDFQIHLFSERLTLLRSFAPDTRLVYDCLLDENTDNFYAAGVNGCYKIAFTYKSHQSPE